MSAPLTESDHRPPGLGSSTRWIMGLLFVGNVLNFYDRALPAVVLEPIKNEFGLDDKQVGVLASAFVLVAAVAGVPLGRLADRIPRKTVSGWGLIVWSVFTTMGGVLTSFWTFFVSRVGVGIGEASYSPATGSLISDLYPTERRSRANATFMLGFPIGTLLAYLTAGSIAVAVGTWRAPFLVAGIPGVIVAILLLRVREPARGATDPIDGRPAASPTTPTTPASTASELAEPGRRRRLREVLSVRSLYGLILAFGGYNFAAYAVGTFLTPVLQRYYGLDLVSAGLVSAVVIGLTGLIGLLVGGRVLDRAARTSPAARVRLCAVSLLAAAVLSGIGLAAGQSALWQLVLFLGLGYLAGIVYLAGSVPAVTDVIEPEQRSSALGVVFAVGYLLGGAGGPILVGALSDSLAARSSLPATVASAQGLQQAMMVLVPIAFAVAAAGMYASSRYVRRDRAAMLGLIST